MLVTLKLHWRLSLVVVSLLFLSIHASVKGDDLANDPTSFVPEKEEQRSPPMELCMKIGCNCNTNDFHQVTEVTCDCRSHPKSSDNQTTLVINDKIIYPPKLQALRISHCNYVELGKSSRRQRELFRISFSLVLIESVGSLVLYPMALKRVANLTMKNISNFLFEKGIDNKDAFDDLDADYVDFQNVTFCKDPTYMGDFRPSRIKTRLEFQSSKIYKSMPILINQENVDDLTVAFLNCRIDGMVAVIDANRIEMVGNHLQSDACVDDCAASEKTITLKYQSLYINQTTYQNKSMPNIRQDHSKGSDIEFEYETGVTDLKMSNKWMKLLDFVPKGNNMVGLSASSQLATPCKELAGKRHSGHHRIACPNTNKMMEYLGEQQRFNNGNTLHFKSYSVLLTIVLSSCFARHLIGKLNTLM